MSMDDAPQVPVECPTQRELREYLGGWSDSTHASRIENHLATCVDCDQYARDHEVAPDTLMQSLQSTAVEPSGNQEDRPETPSETERMKAALEHSRRLMDAPPEPVGPRQSPVMMYTAGQQLGAYKLLRPLGHGGMGAVYLASHSQLEKHVAIKLLPGMSADNDDVRTRFQREIRVVGRLNHPSIVAATDAGEIEGTPFLVMEYVAGRDLSCVVRTHGRLSVPDACELMRQVALGLSCAHAEGVVHRDVKPSNLMLDEAGQVKILDFGLAQLNFWNEASVELTTVGQLMGTLDYMAPEQAESCGNVDYRADLYALGATLFRLLCGRPPLAAAPNQSPLEKLRLLANHVPPSLDVLCPDAPDELVRLVNSLLARHPDDRPASAAHVAEQLQPLTDSADLVNLLRRTVDEESRTPAALTTQGAGPNPGNVAGVVVGTGSGNRRSRRIGRWFAAGLILPLLFLAGVLIKLEIEKGQLIIDSEIDNVAVRVVGENDSTDEISIHSGAKATRLRAGKYELMIDGPSDGVVIDNQQFTIRNGDTIVARIRLQPHEDTTTERIVGRSVPDGSGASELEPIYEGKPLSTWLGLLGRERSSDGLKLAFQACMALTTPDNSAQITAAILRIVPKLNGARNLQIDSNTRSRTVDQYAADILRKANPGPAFQQLWVDEVEKADAEWKERLWGLHKFGYFVNPQNSEPFIAWAEQLLRQPTTEAPTAASDIARAADALRSLVQEAERSEDTELSNRIVTALKSSSLTASWWLKHPLVYRSNQNYGMSQTTEDVKLWSAGMRSHITKIASDVVKTRNPDPTMLVQACMVLTHGAEISPEEREPLLAAANRHLLALCADDDALFESLPADIEFAALMLPTLRPQRRPVVVFSTRNRDAKPYLVLELLDLIAALDGKMDASEGIAALCEKMRPIGRLMAASTVQTEQNSRTSRGRAGFGYPAIDLSWPNLVPTESRGGAAMFARHLWGQHQPAPRDWLGYCIMQHPVIYEEPPEAPEAQP